MKATFYKMKHVKSGSYHKHHKNVQIQMLTD